MTWRPFVRNLTGALLRDTPAFRDCEIAEPKPRTKDQQPAPANPMSRSMTRRHLRNRAHSPA